MPCSRCAAIGIRKAERVGCMGKVGACRVGRPLSLGIRDHNLAAARIAGATVNGAPPRLGGIHTHKADDDEREQAANYDRCDSLVCHDLFPPGRNSDTVISADLSQPAIYRLLRPARRSHAPGMFVVSEADATAIRTAFEQRGELSAAVELRRRFPGILDNAQARECARIIAGWKPLTPLPLLPDRRKAAS